MPIESSSFIYPSPNGNIEGWCVKDRSIEPTGVIIFCRGGTGTFGCVEERIIRYVLTPLADHGLVVYATQYSGGPNSEGEDQYGGSDVEDVLALHDYIKKQESVFTEDKLGLLCFSRGAINGCLALQRGLPVTCAAFVSGMFDLTKMQNERPDIVELWQKKRMFPVTREELKKRSALFFADELPKIPYLFLHAKDDRRVLVWHSVKMSQALAGFATLQIFDGDDHCLVQHSQQRNKILSDFFLG